MITAFLLAAFLRVLCADSPRNDVFRDSVRREIEEGSIVGRKASMQAVKEILIVDLGDVDVMGLGDKAAVLFQPAQHQLQVELLRQALILERDKEVAVPFLANIENEIDREISLVQSPTIDNEKLRSALASHDRAIVELRDAALAAVAKARGLKRAVVKKPAHPPWVVTVATPAGATVRYTPYLNYLLNLKTPEKIDWLTAGDGDRLKLRGRYRVELLKAGVMTDFRQPSVTSDGSIRFD